MPPTLLLTPRLLMRPWRAADAARLAPVLADSDAHLRAWIPHVVDGKVPGQSLADRLAGQGAAFAEGREWVYGIFSHDEQQVLGGGGLFPRVGPGAVELGYWIARSATGRGYATEATEAWLRVAFADPEITRVEIRCDPGNAPSVAIPRRLGFRHATTLMDVADAPEGLMIWELTRAEHARRDPSAAEPGPSAGGGMDRAKP